MKSVNNFENDYIYDKKMPYHIDYDFIYFIKRTRDVNSNRSLFMNRKKYNFLVVDTGRNDFYIRYKDEDDKTWEFLNMFDDNILSYADLKDLFKNGKYIMFIKNERENGTFIYKINDDDDKKYYFNIAFKTISTILACLKGKTSNPFFRRVIKDLNNVNNTNYNSDNNYENSEYNSEFNNFKKSKKSRKSKKTIYDSYINDPRFLNNSMSETRNYFEPF